jgi:uncharacterized protein (DUF983 family)
MPSLKAILRGVCPRCQTGAIYRRSFFQAWLDIYDRCPNCGLRYEREQGYYLGAMYVSYALSVPPVGLLTWIIWLVTHWRLDYVVLGAFVAYLPAVPVVVRFSRIVWIHIDQWLDPEQVRPTLGSGNA